MTAAEKEIEELFKKYSEKHKQLVKSQDECSTFRSLIANKDTQISSLSNDVERLNSNVRSVTCDNDRLVLERGRITERNMTLERNNERLRRENSGLSELKALKPIGDIVTKRKLVDKYINFSCLYRAFVVSVINSREAIAAIIGHIVVFVSD